MKLRSPHRRPIVLALGTLLSAPSASLGEEQERVPVATTPHFAFYSDFAINLNDALIAAGALRQRERSKLFHSGPEKDCFDALPTAERVAWDRAVDYYAEIIVPSGTMGREQGLVRHKLIGMPDPENAEAQRLIGIADGFRTAAAPAYEACRWLGQDAQNRRWVEELTVLLALHEEAIASTLAQLYQKPWHGLPIPVDVVETVDGTGGNTKSLRPAGGHTLISSANPAYQGHGALEMVFHEASHLLMTQNDPVWRALDKAAEALGEPTPEDLWHVVLFYTTGETVRRVLDEAGEPGYTPVVYEIFERSRSWGRYQDAIERTWPAYLDGKRTLSETAADLIQATLSQTGE